jgi:carboxypeptidase C (cathepsin A)
MARLLLLLLLGTAAAAPAGDRVAALPQWAGPLRSPHYSGYLDGGAGRRTHYYLVESEANASSAPLVVWLNGGPGCSSLIGWGVELGPLTMGPNGTLTENAGRWNAAAHVLYLESPVGALPQLHAPRAGVSAGGDGVARGGTA